MQDELRFAYDMLSNQGPCSIISYLYPTAHLANKFSFGHDRGDGNIGPKPSQRIGDASSFDLF